MEMEAMLTTQDVLPAVIWGSLLTIIILLAIWEMIWKGIALWHAGNKKQLTWFIFIFIFNTAGILPIIYLILNRKKKGK
mgnify:CR=1 FL=1